MVDHEGGCAGTFRIHLGELMIAGGVISSRYGRRRARSARNRLLPLLATLALGLGTLLPTPPASAGGCSCFFSQALIPDIKSAGRIESVQNTVLATTPQGWQAAQPGQSLAIGDSVRTGHDGNALVRIGAGCSVRLAPQSTLIIRPVDHNYCVAVDRPAPFAKGQVHAKVAVPGGKAVF